MRHAENLATGRGLVFNPGDKLLVISNPLYVFLLTGLRLLGFNIPAASNGIGILSIAATAAIVHRMFAARDLPWWGVAAAFLLLIFPHSYRALGSDRPLYTTLVMASFLAYCLGRRLVVPWLWGAVTLTRFDGFLVALTTVASDTWKRRALPFREALIYGAILLALIAFNFAYFQAPFRQDLGVQHLGAELTGATFLKGAYRWVVTYTAQSVFNWLYVVLPLMGLAYILVVDRGWLPLVLWAASYVALYVALGLPGAHWYYVPLVPVIIILAVLGLRWSAHLLGRLLALNAERARTAVAAVSLIALLLGTGALVSLYILRGETWESSRFSVYKQAAEWLANNASPNATVGLQEVGIMGFYSGLHVVDFNGQMTPEVAAANPKSQTEAALWAVQRFRPDFVAIIPSWLPKLVESDAFRTSYVPVARFTDPQFIYGEVVVYKRAGTP
ncbi:MAG: hypothetical protein HY684_00350 [Chloroflexi bacterium]|nr:hypothetical protein [Chloroflexota bacterium]